MQFSSRSFLALFEIGRTVPLVNISSSFPTFFIQRRFIRRLEPSITKRSCSSRPLTAFLKEVRSFIVSTELPSVRTYFTERENSSA